MLTLRRQPSKSEPVERREQLAQASAARATRDRRVGMLVIWVGVAIFLFGFLVVSVLWYAAGIREQVVGLPLLLVWAFSLAVVQQGRRMRARGGERVLAEDKRAPIVYLRPFDADGVEIPSAWSSRVRASPWQYYITHEQRLTRALRKVGPLVAIGDPTEDLPQLGAARVYATDEEWQARVDELSMRAGVVLFQTGDSEGLAWEVDHVVGFGAPERVILALPQPGKRKTRHERYDAFRRSFGDVFPRGLPASIGHSEFAYFDADWTPRLVARGVPLPGGDKARDVALRRLAREFKITWGPRWARYAVYIFVLFAAVFGVELVTGDFQSSMRVDGCAEARASQLQALKPPFATSDSAVRKYASADCQALEDKHLLAGGGKLESAAAHRLRCERYTGALYDYEPAERRGSRRRWGQVASRYCATRAVPNPAGTRLLQIAAEVNRH